MGCLGGTLLIASPYLADRNFFRSVVLIVSHDDEHAFGLLLNRPGYESLSGHWENQHGKRYDRSEMLRSGGPLNGPLMVLHQLSKYSDSRIISNIHLATIKENVNGVVASGA